MAEQEHATICPWCDTEIVWDEEIGPEKHCPHCDNELSGYRTLTLGDDEGDGDQDWKDAEAGDDGGWLGDMDGDGYRQGDLADLAARQSVEKVLEDQDEVPECPACREYMVLTGEQTVTEGFEPVVPKALGRPLLEAPVRFSLYVCPACFETSTKLSPQTRKKLIESLAGK
ncbi:hypothetical protein [Paenibacillus beijingensis]|uniref:Uncharacterized protein n=1 Tax=Paenibacillus beijingensis TaxID=1126833 RepID=A0A0D5NE53_9BACL|nr:hypothetical protein [Paenibacillus beijingensis]AJY73644.1 hypothetical protein VN24_02130 [Paenibacillus beijingensis]